MLEHTFSLEKLARHVRFIPLFTTVSLKNRSAAQTPSPDYCAASLAAVTCWVKVPMMGDFPFAHLA
jgi:hypothetical protein